MKITRIPAVLFLAVYLVMCAGSGAHASDYVVNGQERTVLSSYPWGSVVYSPTDMTNYSVENQLGTTIVHTAKGDVKISNPTTAGVSVEYPDYKVNVETNYNTYTVTANNLKYIFSVDSNGNLQLTFPDDSIKYTKDLNKLTIDGKRGRVEYNEDFSEVSVKSPAGVTKVSKDLYGGISVNGAAISSHPYRYTVVEFYSNACNIGVIVDLRKIYSFGRIPDYFKWDQGLRVMMK